jgi:hypothetical protein
MNLSKNWSTGLQSPVADPKIFVPDPDLDFRKVSNLYGLKCL